MKIFFLTISILVQICGFGQEQSSHEKRELERIIKNKIKSITSTKFEFNDGELEKNGYKSYYREYEKNGVEIKIIAYRRDGQIQTQMISNLDKTGLIISHNQEQYNQNGQIEYSSQTFCDSLGRPAKTMSYEGGVLESFERFTYNKDGQLVKDEIIAPNDTVEYITNYTYDSYGQLIEDHGLRMKKDEEGNVIYFTDRRYIYTNYKDRNEIERLMFLSNGELSSKAISIYDSLGNETEYSLYDSDYNLLTKQVFIYDKYQNKIEWHNYDASGQIRMQTKSKYDKNGNLIEEIWYNENEPDRKIKYEYEFFK